MLAQEALHKYVAKLLLGIHLKQLDPSFDDLVLSEPNLLDCVSIQPSTSSFRPLKRSRILHLLVLPLNLVEEGFHCSAWWSC